MRTSTSYRAFHLPRLVAGVGLRTGTNIWMCVIASGVIVDSMLFWIIFVLVGATVHSMLAWFFKQDHKLFEAYGLHIQSKDRYDVGSNSSAVGFTGMTRPRGYGKGFQC